ncbi:MAG TPA: aminomethyl-transferring glycine dehydrogenase subunit GcvPB [Lachnospiraceae bacterium]|nr:aminomethyl-transferring glycine dehydrogenase subunit GcvPB [Lachnospiraceae bacterium]
MKLIFEEGNEGHRSFLLPKSGVPEAVLPESLRRAKMPSLPQVSEPEISRHYTNLLKNTYGVNDGFYPLGSCTMKYNPKIADDAAALPGFTDIHPLQPAATVQGALELIAGTEKALCEVTGMDAMTFQPSAGAHGEFTGLLLIAAYHRTRGDFKRTKIIVPDSAHGTNPASCTMAGFTAVNVKSGSDGLVDLEALRAAVGEDTAGLMLTNPNTAGLFDKNILEITRIIHEAGGLNYYDGANLNAVIGIARPKDMGFDCVHLNLHKTFATPHGGGGPGAGAVGCREFLAEFLPKYRPVLKNGGYVFENAEHSIGSVRSFSCSFLIVVRAFAYIEMLGAEGLRDVAVHAVLNANYMRVRLADAYHICYNRMCMHEFVMTISDLKEQYGVSALDAAKGLIDEGIHPPTIYFPLIVPEAMMVEPTETESRAVLDDAVEKFLKVRKKAEEDPESLHTAPHNAAIGRPDEVAAARHPVLRWQPGTS